MKRFEYFKGCNLIATRLNELGLQGWELVSVTVVTGRYESNSYYYFKRELQ